MAILNSHVPCLEMILSTAPNRCLALDVIDHFVADRKPWLGSPRYQKIIQEHGVSLALTAPYLRHAIIATSAAHLTTMNPDNRVYRLASRRHYHCSMSLISYIADRGLEKANVDAVFATTILWNILDFFQAPKVSEEVSLNIESTLCWALRMPGLKTAFRIPEFRSQLENGI